MEQTTTLPRERSEGVVITISLVVATIVIFIAQYLIGKQEIHLGSAVIPILPMLFAVIIGMTISTHAVRNKIKAWGKLFTEKEEGFCSKMVGFSLLILGTQYAGMIVPNLEMILNAGIPLFLQESVTCSQSSSRFHWQ